jgi:uncharacterized RDD family membrane protein YckC
MPGDGAISYAGFWIRFLAAVIDSLLLSLIIAPLFYWFYGSEYFATALGPLASAIRGETQSLDINVTLGGGPMDILFTYVLPAVAIVVFWIARQATPGKMVLSLRIVDAKTLGPLSKGQAIGRYLGYYVSTIPFCLGLLWVAFDARKQGWHDKLAATLVIREKRP